MVRFRPRFPRLLPIVLGAALLRVASPAEAGPHRWTPYGPGGGLPLGLAFDPHDPQTLFGFWRNFNFSFPLVTGGGFRIGDGELYRSHDGGQTWEWLSHGFSGMYVQSFVVDPSTPGSLYASTAFPCRALHSTDGGQTWSTIYESDTSFGASITVLPGAGGEPTLYLADGQGLLRSQDSGVGWTRILGRYAVSPPVADPQDTRRLYIGVAAANGGSALLRSDDAGETWVELPAVSQEAIPRPSIEAIEPGSGAIYVVDADRLYRSADQGTSWSPVPDLPMAQPGVVRYRVDPSRPARRYLLAFHPGESTGEWGVYASEDAGSSWRRLAPSGADAVDVHPTTGELFVHFFSTTLRSRDAGRSFEALSGRGVLGFATATFWRGPNPAVVFRGDGGWSLNGGRTWTPRPPAGPQGDPIAAPAVDPQRPKVVYAARPEGVYRSTDKGRSWILAGVPSWEARCGLFEPRLQPVTVVAASSHLLLAFNHSLSRSTDGGHTWQRTLGCTVDPRQPDSPLDDVVRKVEALTVDPRDANQLWADVSILDLQEPYPERRFLYRSRNGGASWEEFAPGWSRVLYAPSDPRRLFLAREDGLWRSNDGGRSFRQVSPLRLRTDFWSLEVDSQNPEVLMMAGANGIAQSRDGGATWLPVNAGLWRFDRARVWGIVAHPRVANLYYAYPLSGGTFEGSFP